MKRLVACGLFAIGSLVAPGAASASSVPGGHCPPKDSGYIRWDVSTEPYQADNQVDARGNNNGTVCAKPTMKVIILPDGTPLQIYNFIDDNGNGQVTQ